MSKSLKARQRRREARKKQIEQFQLQQEAYRESVNIRVKNFMALSVEKQEEAIREMIIAGDDSEQREKELVEQIQDCVTMLGRTRAKDGESDPEMEDLRTRAWGI